MNAVVIEVQFGSETEISAGNSLRLSCHFVCRSELLDQEEPSCVLERTFQVVTSPEPHRKQTGPTDSAASKCSRTLEDPSSSGGPPIQDVTWSIKEEVKRLMQESAPDSAKTPRATKQPVRQTHRTRLHTRRQQRRGRSLRLWHLEYSAPC